MEYRKLGNNEYKFDAANDYAEIWFGPNYLFRKTNLYDGHSIFILHSVPIYRAPIGFLLNECIREFGPQTAQSYVDAERNVRGQLDAEKARIAKYRYNHLIDDRNGPRRIAYKYDILSKIRR